MHAIGPGPPLIIFSLGYCTVEVIYGVLVEFSLGKGKPPFIIIPPSVPEESFGNTVLLAVFHIFRKMLGATNQKKEEE
jgi:hypothetical protein